MLLLLATAAMARERDPMRAANVPVKCGRIALIAAHGRPGNAVAMPAGCGQVQVPARYELRQGRGPGAVDVYLRERLMATLVAPLSFPEPPALIVTDKRPRHFATTRWHRAGAEFVSISLRLGAAPTDEKEALQ